MKGRPMIGSLLALITGLALAGTALAQTSTDPNEGSHLTYDGLLGSYCFSWWGQPGRTYFLQHSGDLSAWEYLPIIESGTNDVRAWGFTSTASKFFLRLRSADISTTDPFTADFDGDKVGNYDELLHGTDPLLSLDTDANGLPDDWEKFYFSYVGVDPNATAPGGGMTNQQHFDLGSNPNNPPPPPTLTAGTATLDQSADTLLYPANETGLLLQNGNFSQPALGTSNWKTYAGITGWTALSGSLIELQQINVNTTAGAGQYCELDAHWPTADHSGAPDHGLQQTVNFPRGHYLLFFDYRARQTGADSFTVKLQPAGSSTETLLLTKNAATTNWQRASVPFEVTGGNPNLPTLPITLIFDEAGAKDSYGPYIDNVILLPVEITWEAIDQTAWANVSDNKSQVDFEYRNGVYQPERRWLPGRGRRVFPDKKNPADTVRNRVALKIHTVPNVIPGNKVYLKAFDVDDATDEYFDQDDGTSVVIDTNGKNGNDNKDGTWLKTGQFIVGAQTKGAAIDVALDSNGDATVIFETTMQPGDNFRVALAFKQEDLNLLQVDNPNGAGFAAYESDKQPGGFNGVVSPLLTVWRKLHIEEDTMAQVDIAGAEKNFETGVIDSVTAAAGGQFNLRLSISLSGGYNRFENGKIFIDGWRYKVVNNHRGVYPNDTTEALLVKDDDAGHLAALNTAGQAVGKAFQIFDDDDDQMPNDLRFPLTTTLITDAVKSKFVPAYIEVTTTIENNTKIVPFKLNREAPYPDPADNTDSQAFWVHRVVAAYQPIINEDGDPDSENSTGATLGATNRSWNDSTIDSLIYLETIRDGNRNGAGVVDETALRYELYGVVAHEIGHGPGSLLSKLTEADHQENGLMTGTGPLSISLNFRAKTILRFRKTDRWH